MNKIAKGAVAAGAATLLLIGGAGTLAYWSDSAVIDGGTITAGTLDVELVSPSWLDITNISPTSFDPATDRIAPGSVVQYSATANVTATGDFPVVMQVDAGDITGALTPYVFVTMTIDGLPYGDEAEIEVPADEANQSIPIVVTFTFDNSVSNQVGQGQSLSLADFRFSVTQALV